MVLVSDLRSATPRSASHPFFDCFLKSEWKRTLKNQGCFKGGCMYVTVSFESLCSAVEKPMFLRPTVHSAVFFLDRQDLHTFAARQNSEKPNREMLVPEIFWAVWLAARTHTHSTSAQIFFPKTPRKRFLNAAIPLLSCQAHSAALRYSAALTGSASIASSIKLVYPPFYNLQKIIGAGF